MRAVTKNAIFTALALCLVLVTGCVATNQPKGNPVGDERPAVNNEGAAAAKQPNRPPVGVAAELATAEACPEPPPDPQAESRMTTFGQAITDHKVIPRWGMDKVEFATKDKIRTMEDGKLWAYVPDDVLSGRVRVASIYWHGNDVKKYFIRNPHKTIEEARSIERDADPIAVYRPHSTSIWTAGSRSEIHLHLALVEYLRETFGVCRFNLYGSSGSGAVVAAVAQERPHLTATVGLASPLLAVKAAYPMASLSSVYDPLHFIGNLSPDIPVLIVYDRRDLAIKPIGVDPYVEKAGELGLKVKLVEVRANDRLYHATHSRLGRELRKPENQAFRPRR